MRQDKVTGMVPGLETRTWRGYREEGVRAVRQDKVKSKVPGPEMGPWCKYGLNIVITTQQ
jgi:hypothetical protein